MENVVINILTSPAFPLITLLLGFLIGHRLSIGRDKRQEFNKAATIFREAFLPEITYLRHNANIGNLGSSTNLNELLFYGYVHRHLKALEIFKPNLSRKDRVGIDKAWKEYCCHPDNPKIPFFEKYSWMVANKGKDYENELKTMALNRIENILKFAKTK
jgi:hypothetical protein